MTTPAKLYCITCRTTGKMYVGKTVQPMQKRWNGHVSDARRLKNKFVAAIEQYGTEDFECILLHEYKSEAEAYAAEEVLIAALDLTVVGYNTAKGIAGGFAGGHHTPEARAKISAAKKGVKRGPHRASHCAAISAANRLRVYTPEILANYSAAQTGKTMSKAAKEKMSAAKLGVKRGPRSIEVREKISAGWARRRDEQRASL
jgi:group I intron endonuclease